ncbi:hypothetical protein GCM10027048_30620 [Hymenobacter coalescens]
MLDHLLDAGHIASQSVRVEAGKYLFRLGQPRAGVYWLDSGCVGLWSEQVTSIGCCVLRAPALFGAVHLLQDYCLHTAVALTACAVRVMDAAHLLALTQHRPALRLYLLRCLCQETKLDLPHYE